MRKVPVNLPLLFKVLWLVQNGANLNAVGGRHRQSPLHLAARGAHLAILQILIEAGEYILIIELS